ncbi:MAG: hypothetical protein ABW187_00510 [Dokdonella sp.]
MPLTPKPASPPSPDRPADLRFATDALPWQRSLRWTRPARDRHMLLLGARLALLVTVLELIGFAAGMHSYRRAPAQRPVIEVKLIEPEPVLPPPPPDPEPPQFVRRQSRIVIAPPKVRTTPPPAPPQETSDAMTARMGNAGAPAPPPQLFNPDGSIRLGEAGKIVTAPSAPKNPQEAAKARWAEIQKKGENPLDCKKTRFAQAFAPDESVGSGIARKYLSWAGLYDPHDTQKRAARAAEGCDPAQ